ncbi:unnamed protein product [Meganyctiphanes norvegica]|uniref:Glutathione S-transferase n=1 Tax=Meganyctiphanes norvegica TaxID=48144 RepID=A0AAV2SAN4_MEGNR
MSYHLQYMSLRARGEPVRWVLQAVGADYTEETVDVLTEWAQRKKDFEWKVNPVLVIGGKDKLHQTTVICRYLGEKHGLCSSDAWTKTRQQECVEAMHDACAYIGGALQERIMKNEANMKAKMITAAERTNLVMGNIEKRISPEGWVLSPKMTWVDVFLASYLDLLELYNLFSPDVSTACPKMTKLLAKVREVPAVAKRIKERPDWHMFENPNGLN